MQSTPGRTTDQNEDLLRRDAKLLVCSFPTFRKHALSLNSNFEQVLFDSLPSKMNSTTYLSNVGKH